MKEKKKRFKGISLDAWQKIVVLIRGDSLLLEWADTLRDLFRGFFLRYNPSIERTYEEIPAKEAQRQRKRERTPHRRRR